MGTRADFYIGRLVRVDTENLTLTKHTWLGSIAWDGYPKGVPAALLRKKKVHTFLSELKAFFKKTESATDPEKHGWPWPWTTSSTTDWAYIFDPADGKVHIVNFSGYAGSISQWSAFNEKSNEWHRRRAELDDIGNKKRGRVIRTHHADYKIPPELPPEPELNLGEVKFPDMTALQNVDYGSRSGLIVL